MRKQRVDWQSRHAASARLTAFASSTFFASAVAAACAVASVVSACASSNRTAEWAETPTASGSTRLGITTLRNRSSGVKGARCSGPEVADPSAGGSMAPPVGVCHLVNASSTSVSGEMGCCSGLG